jgi:hypothetical protein
MRIDALLPHCDFYERHAIVVRATPERAYDVVANADLSRGWIIRMLMALRGITKPTRSMFSIAAEDPPRELVLGIEGPFWRPTCKPYAPDFGAPVPPDVARAAWNFFIEPIDDARVRVTTETRILCGEHARRRFALYWLLVRPGSGLIRRLMLRTIRREAER